jgi:hypothetical protein
MSISRIILRDLKLLLFYKSISILLIELEADLWNINSFQFVNPKNDNKLHYEEEIFETGTNSTCRSKIERKNKHMKKLNKIRLSLILILLLVVTTVAPIMGMAVENQPKVKLGTTSQFAILAGTTITNTGTTTINGSNGDVGMAPGTEFTGKASVSMSGETNFANPVAINAKKDLVTAYDDAAGRTPTRIPTELGGTTLTPGTYDSADGTFQITGTLTLDAQGDPDGVFIFQTAATLITASGSTVDLINDAQSCRTFWKVGSSATLGTNSQFVGSIFALTSISATTGAIVRGQLLARNGSVTLENNTITNAICAGTPVVVPPVVPSDGTTPVVVPPAVVPPAVVVPGDGTTPVVVTPTALVEDNTPVADTTTVTGQRLPNTASPLFNFILIGSVLTIMGTVLWRRKLRA